MSGPNDRARCPGPVTEEPGEEPGEKVKMPEKVWNVLFLCSGNSARSIMAEALLNALGEGRFRAFSAGSRPAGAVHAGALAQLAAAGLPTEGLRSKSWDEFAAPGAPEMDAIITLCDGAAGDACPAWPGHPVTAHWGLADPAACTGTEAEKARAFARAFEEAALHIRRLVAMPWAEMETQVWRGGTVRARASAPNIRYDDSP